MFAYVSCGDLPGLKILHVRNLAIINGPCIESFTLQHPFHHLDFYLCLCIRKCEFGPSFTVVFTCYVLNTEEKVLDSLIAETAMLVEANHIKLANLQYTLLNSVLHAILPSFCQDRND